jgi:hypothetical protein
VEALRAKGVAGAVESSGCPHDPIGTALWPLEAALGQDSPAILPAERPVTNASTATAAGRTEIPAPARNRNARRLDHAGPGRADQREALRPAQIETRKTHPAPIYWAAFEITGAAD